MSWESYDSTRGPSHLGFKILALIVGLGVVAIPAGFFLGWFGEAAQVAREELGPKALRAKYEWFKNASAALGKKIADIKVYESRLNSLMDAYKGVSRKDWPRDDREQFSIWQSECAGVKASYNSLAAEYNAQMAKINWAFANVGSMPDGSMQSLPREYKPYIEE